MGKARIDAITEMTCAASEGGELETFDPAWLTFSGRSFDEERGLGWTRRIHPEDRERFLAEYGSASARSAPFLARLRLLRADGQYRWISWTGAPAPPGDPRYLGICFDITDALPDLLELRRFWSGFDADGYRPPGAFYALQRRDGTLELQFLSDAAAQLIGCPADELYEDPSKLLAAIHPEDRQQTLDQVSAAARAPQALALEHRVAGAEGAAAGWLRWEAAPRRLPNRDVVWSGFLRDVSERKRFEEVLRERERHYETVLRTSIDGYWTTDLQGRFLEVNQAYCDLIGYSSEELLQMSIRDVEAQESAAETARHIEALTRNGSDRFLTRHRRKDETTVDIEVSTVYLPESGGRLVVFLRDVTERVRAEAERGELLRREQEARTLAEEASRAKDAFLATLSHELRTPLSPILLYAQMLKKGRLGLDRVEHAAAAIERNALMQAQLVDDLLDVSRITKGKLTIEKIYVDPAAPLLAALESIRPLAREKQVEVELEESARLGLVHADPMRLQQVFSNLLANAVKFTQAGGRVTVRVEPAERDGRGRAGRFIQVAVHDTGRGIGPEALPHIFEPFAQEDSSSTRTSGGLGLGLAIVERLLDLHDGSAAAESPGVGKGATFTVWLPLIAPAQADAPPWEQAAPTASSDQPPGHLSGLDVLVVDDDRLGREAVAQLLSLEGARVRTASSAAEALERITQAPPQVLLADIAMPLRDGYSLLAELRAQERAQGRPPLPAVALTALAGEHDLARACEVGFQRHLAKPVDAGALVSAVRQVVSMTP